LKDDGLAGTDVGGIWSDVLVIETVSVSRPLDKHLFESVANRMPEISGKTVERLFDRRYVRYTGSHPAPGRVRMRNLSTIGTTGTRRPEMSALTVTPTPTLPRLRITARGRAVLLTLAAAPLVVAAVIAGLSGGNANASLEDSSATFTYVTVAPGQSLWSIAEAIAPQADPREVVADIVSLNQLGSADVEAGERIAIPTEYAH
jgi:hypothetical protein